MLSHTTCFLWEFDGGDRNLEWKKWRNTVIVESLSMSGKALRIPVAGLNKQWKIIGRHLIKEFGLPVCMVLLLQTLKQQKKITVEYPDAVAALRKTGNDITTRLCRLGALFYVMAERRGRRRAYGIMEKMMRDMAAVAMPEIYRIAAPDMGDGEVFAGFKAFTRALFTEIDRIGLWKHAGFYETDTLLSFKITSCMNVEFYRDIGCPEVAKLQCEYNHAGYLRLESATESEFRRPCTLAEGGGCCCFQFYRKGTAPAIVRPDQ